MFRTCVATAPDFKRGGAVILPESFLYSPLGGFKSFGLDVISFAVSFTFEVGLVHDSSSRKLNLCLALDEFDLTRCFEKFEHLVN